MKKTLLGIAVAFALAACNKGEEVTFPVQLHYPEEENVMMFYYVDSEGNDMLNPNPPTPLNIFDFKVTYVVKNGVTGNIYRDNYGFGPVLTYDGFVTKEYYRFYLFTMTSKHNSVVFDSDDIENITSGVSESYIHWPDGTVDKIEARYVVFDYSVFLANVTINDSYEWEKTVVRVGEGNDAHDVITQPVFKITVDGDTRTITEVLPISE